MIGLEAQGQLAVPVQQRALDHRRVLQQEGARLGGVEPLFGLVRQGAKSGAAAVEQRLPAELAQPAVEVGRVQAVGTVVVKAVVDAGLLQPLAGFLDGVAVFGRNAVKNDFALGFVFHGGHRGSV